MGRREGDRSYGNNVVYTPPELKPWWAGAGWEPGDLPAMSERVLAKLESYAANREQAKKRRRQG